MNRVLSAVVLFSVAYFAWNHFGLEDAFSSAPGAGDRILEAAFRDQATDLQVEGSGTVIGTLSDDNDGDRHQRFILRLNSGQTLLVAHNIDLAPRIATLSKGDLVSFHGEYEWNSKGGVIHWTHHDPNGLHIPGWLKHQGRTYQ